MNEMHSTLDRLEARLDYQAARIDALYRALERHGVDVDDAVPRGDALFDDAVEARDVGYARRPRRARPARRATRLRLGQGTGV